MWPFLLQSKLGLGEPSVLKLRALFFTDSKEAEVKGMCCGSVMSHSARPLESTGIQSI